MKREELLRKILKLAKKDRNNRRDPRYLKTMGFFVAKGFLRTNQPVPILPNQKLRIVDAIWAARNVEPRIMEVLPAAILRLPRHFDLNRNDHPELFATVERLKNQERTGTPLLGVPYEKIRTWATLPLPDRRMKLAHEKKITRTYRLRPEIIARLKQLSKKLDCTETEALERAILK